MWFCTKSTSWSSCLHWIKKKNEIKFWIKSNNWFSLYISPRITLQDKYFWTNFRLFLLLHCLHKESHSYQCFPAFMGFHPKYKKRVESCFAARSTRKDKTGKQKSHVYLWTRKKKTNRKRGIVNIQLHFVDIKNLIDWNEKANLSFVESGLFKVGSDIRSKDIFNVQEKNDD